MFDPSGQALVAFPPAFRYPWFSQPTPKPAEARYMAEVTDDAGETYRVLFDALVSGSQEQDENHISQHGFFEVAVAVPSHLDVATVRIMDAAGDTEFGKRLRSAPPSLAILEPAPGTQLADEVRVSWEISDPDTESSELLSHVVFSPDEGESWQPIATNISDRQGGILFRAGAMPPTAGTGIIRVLSSDGLNTVFADSPGLATSGRQYAEPHQEWLEVVSPTQLFSVRGDPLWMSKPGESYRVVLEEDSWALAIWEGDSSEWSVWIQLVSRVELGRL
jgi:hypothetical protein